MAVASRLHFPYAKDILWKSACVVARGNLTSRGTSHSPRTCVSILLRELVIAMWFGSVGLALRCPNLPRPSPRFVDIFNHLWISCASWEIWKPSRRHHVCIQGDLEDVWRPLLKFLFVNESTTFEVRRTLVVFCDCVCVCALLLLASPTPLFLQASGTPRDYYMCLMCLTLVLCENCSSQTWIAK